MKKRARQTASNCNGMRKWIHLILRTFFFCLYFFFTFYFSVLLSDGQSPSFLFSCSIFERYTLAWREGQRGRSLISSAAPRRGRRSSGCCSLWGTRRPSRFLPGRREPSAWIKHTHSHARAHTHTQASFSWIKRISVVIFGRAYQGHAGLWTRGRSFLVWLFFFGGFF